MMRSPFFLPSGFTAQDIVNMIESNKDNRLRLKKIKQRKQIERRQIKWSKQYAASNGFLDSILDKVGEKIKITLEPTKKAREAAIQYGIDLCTWWGEQHE